MMKAGGQLRELVGYLIAQEPGPPGSPHVPHASAAALLADEAAVPLTANADSCLSRSALVHAGQAGILSARVRNSK